MMIIRARILEFGLCGWMMAGDYEYLSQQWLPQDKFNVDSRFLQSDWRRTSFGDSHTSKQSAMMNQWHGTDLWPPWRCRSPLRTRMTWWCFNSLLDGAFNSLLGRCFCKACLGGAFFMEYAPKRKWIERWRREPLGGFGGMPPQGNFYF